MCESHPRVSFPKGAKEPLQALVERVWKARPWLSRVKVVGRGESQTLRIRRQCIGTSHTPVPSTPSNSIDARISSIAHIQYACGWIRPTKSGGWLSLLGPGMPTPPAPSAGRASQHVVVSPACSGAVPDHQNKSTRWEFPLIATPSPREYFSRPTPAHTGRLPPSPTARHHLCACATWLHPLTLFLHRPISSWMEHMVRSAVQYTFFLVLLLCACTRAVVQATRRHVY
jgi:hypothetical protein